MTDETKVRTIIKIDHQKTGKSFEVEVHYQLFPNRQPIIRYSAFGSNGWKFVMTKEGPAIQISKSFFSKIKQDLFGFLGVPIPQPSGIALIITPESFQQVESFLASVEVQAERLAAEHLKAVEQQPVYYLMHDYFHWGDYSSDREREIIRMRKALPYESGDQIKDRYTLWNNSIGDKQGEWESDLELVRDHVTAERRADQAYRFTITNEMAEKWINVHAEREEEKARAQAKMLQKKRAEEERAKQKQEKIKAGEIFFHCESHPHKEDLTEKILNAPAPQGGSFTLEHRVEKDVFSIIAQYGTYYNAETIEDFDMFGQETGWRFTVDALRALVKEGRTVYVGENLFR